MRGAVLLLLIGCASGEPAVGPGPQHPRLVAPASSKEAIKARLDRPPTSLALAAVVERAARPYETPDPLEWDHGAHGHNGQIAQSNAMLAWLLDDEAAARKAVQGFELLTTDFETNQTWDVNIRMPHVLMPYTAAWDLLRGTTWFSEAEADDARARITDVAGAFFDRYVRDPFLMAIVLRPAQNNHPIRTACALGYVALAFPDHPDADAWGNWAFSELDYLWSAEGRYVQPDGGVSEGPFYYGFAYAPSVALFLALEHGLAPHRTFHRDCRNRQDVPPWDGQECLEGEEFRFESPLHSELFAKTVDWSIGLRLPDGLRPPLGDAYFNPLNGAALMQPFTGEGHYRWDWETNVPRPFEMGHGADLAPYHLAWLDDSVPLSEPPWLNRFLPDAGNAVFRSDWGPDAVWGLLLAEHGAARMTLHDHVDGTSFTLAAYGEYLLVDPGYYKPNDLDNAVTAHAPSHNVILVDGRGAPNKGLLTDFGDADAFLEHGLDTPELAYAEARQSYEGVDITRGVAFVDGRYFAIADRLQSAVSAQRTYTWRMGGNAGYTAGGSFALTSHGARWERDLAGVDVFVAATTGALAYEEPAHRPDSAPHVDRFALDREVRDHAVLDAVNAEGVPGFLAVLAPYAVGAAGDRVPLEITPLDLGPGVAAWEVRGADFADLHALGPGVEATWTLPDGTEVATDGAYVMVRFDGGDLALVVGGTHVTVDGVQLDALHP